MYASFHCLDHFPVAIAASLLNYFAFYCLQLYQISLQTKKEYNADVPVEMISYSANLGFSHNSIYLDPNLSNVIG